eukprot:TRINITY_DN5252_c0_g1_i1.p1 TRINITY_DN5252_c0_g1~~TRINITY_DN5252_c0_g1_i1.p1  ORF type:complete len:1077 (+),score=435.46 TRINITY_DN5252_c0_g1_i1:151-3381(+)
MKPTGPWPPLFPRDDARKARPALAVRTVGGARFTHVGSKVYTAQHVAVEEPGEAEGGGPATGWDVYQLAKVAREWEAAYAVSASTFSSLCLRSEVFLRQVIAGTAHLGAPNPLRTAACCVVFNKLACTDCRDLPVLRLLYDELLGSTYSIADAEAAELDPEPTLEWHLSKTLWYDRFKAMRESFLRFHSVAEVSSKILSRQQMVLAKAIRTWQNMLLARHLLAWKALTVRIRTQRSVGFQRHYQRHVRTTLRQALWMWRSHVIEAIKARQEQMKHEQEAKAEKKATLLREEASAYGDQVARLQNEKQILEEELTRHREIIEQQELALEARAARIEYLERQADGWRQTSADLVRFAWPHWSTHPQDVFPSFRFGDRPASAAKPDAAPADATMTDWGSEAEADATPAEGSVAPAAPVARRLDLSATLTAASVASPHAAFGDEEDDAAGEGDEAVGLGAVPVPDLEGQAPVRAAAAATPAGAALAGGVTPPSVAEELNPQQRHNRDALRREELHLAKYPPAQMPALKLLLLLVGKLIHAQDPDAALPTDMAVSWRDCFAYCHFLNEVSGGTGLHAGMLERELNELKRAEMVFARLRHVVRYDSLTWFITPLDVLNSHADCNFLMLYDILREAFLPHPRGGSSQEGGAVAAAIETLPDGADYEPFREAVVGMIGHVEAWGALFNPLAALTRRVLQTRFQDPESQVFLDERRKRERAAFTTVSQLRMQTLYEERGMDAEEQLGAKEAVEEVLRERYELLHGVWRTYTAGSEAQLMSADKFWLFVSNTGTINRRLPRAQVARVFKAANDVEEVEEWAADGGREEAKGAAEDEDGSEASDGSGWDPEAEGRAVTYNPADELTVAEWVDCLIHFAAYRGDKDDLLHDALEAYIAHLLSSEGVVQSNVQEFREQIYRDDVQRTLGEHNEPLSTIFTYYAQLGSQTRGQADESTDADISYVEFRQCLRDSRLIDAVLTTEVSVDMFNFLQDETADLTARLGVDGKRDVATALPTSSQTLVYREFLEVVVCLAIYKYPAPYVRLADRVQMFITQKMIANLKGIVPNLGKRKRKKRGKGGDGAKQGGA